MLHSSCALYQSLKVRPTDLQSVQLALSLLDSNLGKYLKRSKRCQFKKRSGLAGHWFKAEANYTQESGTIRNCKEENGFYRIALLTRLVPQARSAAVQQENRILSAQNKRPSHICNKERIHKIRSDPASSVAAAVGWSWSLRLKTWTLQDPSLASGPESRR